jgi:hypothetical protein
LILTIGTRGVPVVHRSRLDSRLSPDNGDCLERQVKPVGDPPQMGINPHTIEHSRTTVRQCDCIY